MGKRKQRKGKGYVKTPARKMKKRVIWVEPVSNMKRIPSPRKKAVARKPGKRGKTPKYTTAGRYGWYGPAW